MTALPAFDVAGGVRTLGDGYASRLAHVRRRCDYLQTANQSLRAEMSKVRSLMNGGRPAMEVLLGKAVGDFDEQDIQTIPAANLMLSGIERIAHRLGRRPDERVEPTGDGDSALKSAEKRERIVLGYDSIPEHELEMQLPQLARWAPGYGFAPVVVTDWYDADGRGYPVRELRDPFECWPGRWGVDQQPREIAFVRRLSEDELCDLYPESAAALRSKTGAWRRGEYGAMLPVAATGDASVAGTAYDASRWENQTGAGLALVEYIDREGTTLIVPGRGCIIDHIPNPLRTRAPFYLLKRFAFDELQGQFSQIVGLLGSMARANLLLTIAMEESILVERNIIGGTVGAEEYQTGHDAVNWLEPGTVVQRPVPQLPFQLFQYIDRIEDHARQTARYSKQSDGESPTPWATGRGLDALAGGSTDLELREYQTTFRYAVQHTDAMLLEYDERLWPNTSKPIVGTAEEYTPRTHIRGAYRTKRVYGFMAGWDEPAKVVTGLQLMNAKALSRRTFMQNLDGMENVTKELELVAADDAEQAAYQTMLGMAGQGDARAMMAAVALMPDGDMKTTLQQFFTPEEPQLTPEQEAMIAAAEGAGQAQPLPAVPPDVTTVLSRLGAGGQTEQSLQTVGRV